MRIAFRTDSSMEIGTGHLMRCLSLAAELKRRGNEIYFICRELKSNYNFFVRDRGFHLAKLPLPSSSTVAEESNTCNHVHSLCVPQVVDAKQTIEELDRINTDVFDWLIVDHYALDVCWEKALRSSCRQLMVIDDLADRVHDCDFLVDPGIDSSLRSKYEALTPPHCVHFIGTQYAMLRPEFDEARVLHHRDRITGVPRRVAVLFGGNDASHSTLEALNALKKIMPQGTSVDVIVSVTNMDKSSVEQFCRENSGFFLHVATEQIAFLFSRADLSLGSGGGATYERLFLRLPSILKPVAENQRKPLQDLRSKGLIDLYKDKEELIVKLSKVFEYGVRPPADVVANGIPAICDALMNQLVFLKHPVPFDLRRSFYWLQNRDLRSRFMMSIKPERKTHFLYWRKLIRSNSQCVFSIYHGNIHFGNAGIKHINRDASQAELWLYIGDACRRGIGLGKIILRQLEQYIKENLGCKTAVAHVSQINIPAYQLFCKSRYVFCPEGDPAKAGFHPDLKVVCMEKTL